MIIIKSITVLNNSDYDFLPLEKSSDDKAEDVIIICDSMLNKINCCGLSKSKNAEFLIFPKATSTDIFHKLDDKRDEPSPQCLKNCQ